MRKLALSLMMAASLSANPFENADEVTYDWLVSLGSSSGYTDHIRHFKKIFENKRVRCFLEFGVGFSTKYFIDSCDKVFSIEFVTHGYGPQEIQKYMKLYQGISNWVPVVYFSGFQGATNWAPFKYLGSERVYHADAYRSRTHDSYALMDDSYLKELNTFLLNLTKANRIDVGFVDPGCYLRGDLVQLLFDKVPVIVAHDFKRPIVKEKDPYGYREVVVPDHYEEICFPEGQGTAIWVRRDETALIQALKE